MSFYIDKNGYRKNPIALVAFCAAILDWIVYLVLASLLAEPLYRWIRLENEVVMALLHSSVVAIVSTAACCVPFVLKDKRVVPYGFGVFAGIFVLILATAWTREGGEMLRAIVLLFGIPPVVIGNAVSWFVYWRLGVPKPAPKTFAQEVQEAMGADQNNRTAQFGNSVPVPDDFPQEDNNMQDEAASFYVDE